MLLDVDESARAQQEVVANVNSRVEAWMLVTTLGLTPQIAAMAARLKPIYLDYGYPTVAVSEGPRLSPR